MPDNYVEFPVDQIVRFHAHKKKPTVTPPTISPPYCGSYGYGAIVAIINPGLISTKPYGPNLFPPFVGEWLTQEMNYGPEGEYLPDTSPQHQQEYGTLEPFYSTSTSIIADGWGLVASGILLDANGIWFANQQITGLMNDFGQIGVYRWFVPMAHGQALVPQPPRPPAPQPPPLVVPIVIKSYTINMSWSEVNLFQYGLGVSHPLTAGGAVNPPPAPNVAIFAAGAGAATYTYDFQYKEWANGDFYPIDESNEYDATIGGPAFFWWFHRRPLAPGIWTDWASDSYFQAQLVNLGDSYTWEISGACQQQPPTGP